MPAPFVIPFNNCPSSVINLTSAGYTVPAGKYANVDYALYSGVMSVDGNMIATGSTNSATYASGSTTSTATTEVTMLTATATMQGFFYMQFTAAASINGVVVTFRHRRGGTVINQGAITHDGTASKTIVEYGFSITGDTFTSQSSSGIAPARSITLFGEQSGSASYKTNSNFWISDGAVLTITGTFPVSVSGIIQVYNKIS